MTVPAIEFGKAVSSGGHALMVNALNTWTTFEVTKRRRFSATADLQEAIGANEQGKDSGIILMSFENEDYRLAERVLNDVGDNYVQQNVERNSAEAVKSLEFYARSSRK